MSQELYFAISSSIVLALILLELRTPSFRRGWFRDRGRAKRNWSYLLGMTSTVVLVSFATHSFSKWVPSLVRFERPFALDLILCLLAGELMNYGVHYAQHRSALLWRIHFPHHRETNYDMWLSAHFNVLAIFVVALWMSAVFSVLGFDPLSKQIYFLFFTFVGTLHHSSRDYSFGILDWVIVTPAYHRIHHSRHRPGNYSNSLTFWDVIFGTAIWPWKLGEKTLQFGIASSRVPFGFWSELAYVFRRGDRLPAKPVKDWAMQSDNEGAV